MAEPAAKTFDCVQSMREARDRLSAEIADMNYAELAEWIRSHRYVDPLLERLAANASQRPSREVCNQPLMGSTITVKRL